ncbi:MAG: hypothetical protein JXR70_05435 [Spirochaetales bacterium]|nr:hypothetical protein [Spirochaetales bacterium]
MKVVLVILIILLCLFVSCIGFENRIKINKDGSGEMEFTYRLSRMLLEYGNEEGSEEGETIDTPLPITEEELAEEINSIEGVRLVSASQSEDENDIIISAVIEFDDVNKLQDTETFSAWPISLERKNGQTVYTQILTEGSGDDTESAEMMESFFEGYNLSLRIEAPSPIIDFNYGELESTNVLLYSITIAELFSMAEQEELVVVWK